MKSIVATLFLLVTFQTFAGTITDSISNVIPYGMLTTFTYAPVLKAEAQQVVIDAQDLFQTGNMSLLLAKKIEEVQNNNSELSSSEALDLIIAFAEANL